MLHGVRCRWRGTPYVELAREECLRCAQTGANPCGYPLPIIMKMLADRDPKVVNCSATMLGGCPREHGIKKHREWYVEPDRAYTRAYGSLAHAGSEFLVLGAKDKPPFSNIETEVRFGRPFSLADGRKTTVTAQLDLLHWQEEPTHAVIRDLKLVDTLAPSAIDRKLAHHRIQFSVQRWILEYHAIHVDSIDLDFLSHKGHKTVNLYPEGDPELVYANLMSLGEVETYLQDRIPPLLDALDGGRPLPDPLSDPSQFWRCRNCDVLGLCQQMHGGPIPATI